MVLNLHEKQGDFILSESVETFYISGVGSGKTFILALAAFIALQKKGCVILICAPTTKTLRNSTLKQLSEAWNSIGFVNKRDYVINKQPPLSWNVPAFSNLSNTNILTSKYGAYAILDGLDNFDSHRGIAVDEIMIDEYRDVKAGAREVLLGRLRGKHHSETNELHRIWYATTPPTNPNYIRSIINGNSSDVKFVFGSTYDNKMNLPPNYIKNLENTLDEMTFRREVKGELIALNNKLFAYAFNYDIHTDWLTVNYKLPLYLSFDFNVNPMTCIATQRTPTQIHVIKEWRLANSNIYEMCKVIREFIFEGNTKLTRKPLFPNVYVTGDSTGNNRHVLARPNISIYSEIRNELNLVKENVNVPLMNPTHENSMMLTNRLLTKHPNIKISKECRWLIEDLENVSVLDNGSIDKSNNDRGHLLDCFRYQLHTYDRNYR